MDSFWPRKQGFIDAHLQLLYGEHVWALTPSLKGKIEGPRTNSILFKFRGKGDICTSNKGEAIEETMRAVYRHVNV
jgi:hypothetical protein